MKRVLACMIVAASVMICSGCDLPDIVKQGWYEYCPKPNLDTVSTSDMIDALLSRGVDSLLGGK